MTTPLEVEHHYRAKTWEKIVAVGERVEFLSKEEVSPALGQLIWVIVGDAVEMRPEVTSHAHAMMPSFQMKIGRSCCRALYRLMRVPLCCIHTESF